MFNLVFFVKYRTFTLCKTYVENQIMYQIWGLGKWGIKGVGNLGNWVYLGIREMGN